MVNNFTIPYVTLRRPWVGFTGYQSDAKKFAPSEIAPPSLNCMIDESNRVGQRLGFMTEPIDLTTANNAPTSFYLDEYDVTVFAVGTKLKYYDWTTQTVYDTGVTLTTGTVTRFDAFTGDVYCTNVTDGARRLVFFRTNGAVNAGDNHITIDSDGAARLSVFVLNSGSLIIQGTSEAFSQPTNNSVAGTANNGAGLIRIQSAGVETLATGMTVSVTAVGGTTEANAVWTITAIDNTHFDLVGSAYANAYTAGGTWTVAPYGFILLTGTASKSYADNSVGLVVQDLSTGVNALQKASKVFFWKERMGLIGAVTATMSGTAVVSTQPLATEYFGKFATPANLNDIINFGYGAGGSTTELVGKYGRITNVLPAKDYLYTFKTNQVYSCAAGDVVTSGAGIGKTTPNLKDDNNGCLNEDCACIVGDNEIEYITPDNRILRMKISTVSGAAVQFPDETFDEPIRNLIKDMDKDQTGARSYYHKAKHRSIHQIKILGQWYWLIHSNTTNEGRGCWQPPQQVLFVASFFERNGVLYATDGTDDTVYSIGTTTDDDSVPIQCIMATGDFLTGATNMTTASLEGEVTQAAKINIQSFVTTNKGGRQGGSQKIIDGSKFSYDASHGVGIDPIGGSGVVPVTATVSDWQKEFDIFPSEANRCQIVLTNSNGGYFSLFKFSINGQSTDSFSPSL